MRVLIIGGISSSLLNFRGPLIRAILEQGHEVWACAGEPQQDVVDTLCEWGVRFIPITLGRAGIRPLEDLRTFYDLHRIMSEFQPDAVLAYTIKPVIWGGLAAWAAKITNNYSMITGLGYAFMGGKSPKKRLVGWIAKHLYAVSLKHSRKVFFQNPDDRDLFLNLALIKPDQAVVVNGSGIDLDAFVFNPIYVPKILNFYKGLKITSLSPAIETFQTNEANKVISATVPIQESRHPSNPVRFLLIARLLRAKGICEYIAAATLIRKTYPHATFQLVGDYDPNPSGLKPVEIEEWSNAGVLDYLGHQNDVRPFLKGAHVYVLPSYYPEGTPRTLLEAMASGRAVITTDAPGCRETVRLTAKGLEQRKNNEAVMEGENGYLVRPRDANSIALAMQHFLDNPGLIALMGNRSYEIAKEKYDVHKVNALILQTMGLNQAGVSNKDRTSPLP